MTTPRKFRVWDGEEMRYLHDYDGGKLMLGWDVHGWHVSEEKPDGTFSCIAGQSIDDHALMQHTGLDDAERTPIYEGDVITAASERRGVVYYDQDRAMWRIDSSYGSDLGVLSDLHVLGDRHRNPDLLEASGADQKGDAEYGIQAIAKNLEQLYHDFRRIAK